MFAVGQIVTHVSTNNQVRIVEVGCEVPGQGYVTGTYYNALSASYAQTAYKVEYLDGSGNAYFTEGELTTQSFNALAAILRG